MTIFNVFLIIQIEHDSKDECLFVRGDNVDMRLRHLELTRKAEQVRFIYRAQNNIVSDFGWAKC